MTVVYADANIFLRFLTNDVPQQASRIEKRLRECETGKLQIIVTPIVTVEVIFHLENWYKLSKTEAVDKLAALLSPEWLSVVDRDAVFTALNIYKDKSIDFVDAFLWASAAQQSAQVLSFDADFEKLDPSLRLDP